MIAESFSPTQGVSVDPSPAQHAFRTAVAEVAANAKATLPQAVNGRIEKAMQIVLAGDVELLPDGRTVVGSQSDAGRQYVVNSACECPDSDRPEIDGWCKHRIATAIQKRAITLAQHKLEAMLNDAPAADASPVPQTLPEAPASANVYVELAGRKVQVTLRDRDEEQLLSRMEKLLARFPAENQADTPTPLDPSFCVEHQQPCLRRHDVWIHKAGERDGKTVWCRRKV